LLRKLLIKTQNTKFILIYGKPKFSEERRKIKPLKQKTKDRLVVIGLLALETGLIYNVVINFYNYVVKGMWYFLALAILASVGTAVLFVYLLVILFSYLAKREVLKELSKMSYSTNLDLKLTSTLP
jgi:K+-sensing histidine kinase KdpD